ncbi:MAG: hypothetical protein ACI87E_005097, partial [Mariniblastus sp.]
RITERSAKISHEHLRAPKPETIASHNAPVAHLNETECLVRRHPNARLANMDRERRR